jgi:hypothetical protein
VQRCVNTHTTNTTATHSLYDWSDSWLLTFPCRLLRKWWVLMQSCGMDTATISNSAWMYALHVAVAAAIPE